MAVVEVVAVVNAEVVAAFAYVECVQNGDDMIVDVDAASVAVWDICCKMVRRSEDDDLGRLLKPSITLV